MEAEAERSLPGLPDFRTGLERAGISIEPKSPKPPGELRRDTYTTEEALEVFESLLLLAASAPLPAELHKHPLVWVQAAKALVGLRPEEPSRRLMDFAFNVCEGFDYVIPDRELLRVSSDELGEIISVHELGRAILDGDLQRAQKQAGRLLTVSDNPAMLLDVILEVAARYPGTAVETVPFLHYAQRAVEFVGTRNTADFLLPALEAVARKGKDQTAVTPDTQALTPWEAVPYLMNAPLELINLVAHAVQIDADEHIKGASIKDGLERTLAVLVEPMVKFDMGEVESRPGSAADLLAAINEGDIDRVRGTGRFLAEQGERVWLLEVLEGVAEKQFTPELVLWADGFRMVLKAATDNRRNQLGELAGESVSQLIQGNRSGSTGKIERIGE